MILIFYLGRVRKGYEKWKTFDVIIIKIMPKYFS